MTKAEIKIKIKEKKLGEKQKEGAYLATYIDEDDRIIFFDGWNTSIVSVINVVPMGFNVQDNQPVIQYRNLKKIKMITLEVELE